MDPNWVMACKHCPHIFPNVPMSAAAEHMISAHSKKTVDLDIVWLSAEPCPDPRWIGCDKEHCYRPKGHEGEHGDIRTVKR